MLDTQTALATTPQTTLEGSTSREYLSTEQVAAQLGISRRTVRWLAQHGRLVAVRIGQRPWGFLQKDVDDFWEDVLCKEAIRG